MEEQSRQRNRAGFSRSVRVLEGTLNLGKGDSKPPTLVLLSFTGGNAIPHLKYLLIHPPWQPKSDQAFPDHLQSWKHSKRKQQKKTKFLDMKHWNQQNYSVCLPLPKPKTSSISLTKSMLLLQVKCAKDMPLSNKQGFLFPKLNHFGSLTWDILKEFVSEVTCSCSLEIRSLESLSLNNQRPKCLNLWLLWRSQNSSQVGSVNMKVNIQMIIYERCLFLCIFREWEIQF